MTVRYGLLAELEAQADKVDELAAFIRSSRELAVAETGLVSWYAYRISTTRYGLFDTFETEEARTAHLTGTMSAALSAVASDLLAAEPSVQLVDILANK